MNCEVHQVPMKLVPAGVSKKTGKPYNAFYACSVQGCTWKPGQNPNYPQNPPPQAQTPRYVANNEPEMESREDYGRRLAIHGMVNGLLAAGADPLAIKYKLRDLILLEDAINEALEGRFAEAINVEDIPF